MLRFAPRIPTISTVMTDICIAHHRQPPIYPSPIYHTQFPPIHVRSDIHTEFWGDSTNKNLRQISHEINRDKILILAGDLGWPHKRVYNALLRTFSQNWAHVFVIAGNHEYYQFENVHHKPTHGMPMDEHLRVKRRGESMDEIEDDIRGICHLYPNVTFLQKDSVVFRGIRFLGCTLWTPSDASLAHHMNDYRYIKDFTPDVCNAIHADHVQWLKQKLAKKPQTAEYTRTVVVTHHLPSRQLMAEKYMAHPLNGFYMNDLDDLLEGVDMWCCGHTHTAKYIIHSPSGAQCIVNPVGYTREKTGFDPTRFIHLD